MGSDAESEPSSIPKLRLFSMAPNLHDHAEPSGMLTPPLQTSASVPFRWEEEPGKPRPCTDLILHEPSRPNTNRCLELPPRLAVVVEMTKTPSPTTVLDGPSGVDAGCKSVFTSSSCRFPRERRRVGQRQGSFDSSCSGSWSPNDETGGGQQLLLGGEKQEQQKEKGSGGLFGSFRLRGTPKLKSSGNGNASKDSRGSCVISPSSVCSMETLFFEELGEKKGKRVRRNGSFSRLSHVTRSHFWASLYSGFKQVVPWKKKSKKEGFTI